MLSKIVTVSSVSCLILFGFATGLRAQQKITTEKQALVKELLEVTGAQKNTNAMMGLMLAQSEKDLQNTLAQQIKNSKNLTDQERAHLEKKAGESTLRFTKRFRELFQQADFPHLVEEVGYAVYDKYFTENELRDMIVFYRSPTGKKSIEVMPQLFAESLQRVSEALTTKMQQIVNQIIEEEKKPPTKQD